MAKGQMHGNREAKKPKKEKPKVLATAGMGATANSATRIAESLGRTLVQNIVMLGFFSAVTEIVSREAMQTAVRASVPAGTEELNLKALEGGIAHLAKMRAGGPEKQATVTAGGH